MLLSYMKKINKEIKLARILYPPFSNLRYNPIGILPKKQDGWHMISKFITPSG